MSKNTNTRERTVELKDEIFQLYSLEGKSLNHISKLFKLQRKIMTDVIKNKLNYKQSTKRIPTDRIKNLIDLHKESILAFCKNSDARWLTPIIAELKLSESELITIRANDTEIDEAINVFVNRPSLKSLQDEIRGVREAEWAREITAFDNEVWIDIKGYKGVYQISSLGRVKSSIKVLATQFNPKIGRNQIGLCKNGKTKAFKPYRLVAEAFLTNPDNLPTVNHMDGDCTNDVLSNLEWSSYKEQNYHKNYILKRPIAKAYGKNGKFSRVVIEDKYEFKTLVSAAKFLCVSETTIQRYLSGESKFERGIRLEY